MNLFEAVNRPWAITPAMLREIHAVCQAHFQSEKIDLASLESRMGRPLSNEAQPYEVIDGVAVVSASGVLARRMNMLMQISGGTSTELLARDLRAAGQDAAVHSIVLLVDSPGGTVDGTASTAAVVRQVAALKPLRTLADGAMASAAYWIGAAAGRGNVFISDTTTQVGSIGVVARHVDVSGSEASQGIKTTEITSGRYKRIASEYAPLSPEGRATMQDQCDYVQSLFIESIAGDRGLTPTAMVLAAGEGRVFMGQQAIDAGLVDGVTTLDQLVRTLVERHASPPNRATALPAPTVSTQEKVTVYQMQSSAARAAWEQSASIRATYGSFEAFASIVDGDAGRDLPTGAHERQRVADEAGALALREKISFVAAIKRLGYR